MTDKDNITLKIVHLVAESRKKSGDWPVGEPAQKTPPEKNPGDWPISIRQGDWPLGEVLESPEEMGELAKNVKKNFGVEINLSKSTRLTDLASAIHHKLVTDKRE